MSALPAGIILMWSGPIGTIPGGFVLCDGNNGTPDLRDRFVIGAGDSFLVDDQGGALQHNHPFTGDGHSHTLPSGPFIQAGANFNSTSSVDPAIGTTDNTSSLPPYYALAFIMKT